MVTIDAGTVGSLKVAPSILAADFGRLADAVAEVDEQTDWLHLDVMDGHFVPNVSLGPPIVASLRPYSDRFFDCHLMMSEPGRYLEAFARAGANSCSVHVEVPGTPEHISHLRELGLRVGLALNPDTPFAAVAPFLDSVDLLLVMSVFPGFGGQSFMPEVLEKIRTARREIDQSNLAVDLEVDGGIDESTIAAASDAGANVFVAGSAIFARPNPRAAAEHLRAVAAQYAK